MYGENNMTQPEVIDWEKFANVEVYQRMVRTHGKSRAEQKLRFLVETPREAFDENHIEMIDFGTYGAGNCTCGHALRYGFIVAEQVWGGDCLGYLMEYLNLPTQHIKDALTLMLKRKDLAKYGLEGRKIVLSEMEKEYNEAKRKKKEAKLEEEHTRKDKIQTMIPLIKEGTSEVKDVFQHLTEVECEFMTKLLRDEEFGKFIQNRTWLGQKDERGERIYFSFFKRMLTQNLSEKQIFRVNEALEQYKKLNDKVVDHLGEQKEFYDLVKNNPNFRVFLSKHWLGKPDKTNPKRRIYEKFVEWMKLQPLSERQWSVAQRAMVEFEEENYMQERKELREIEKNVTLESQKDSFTSVKNEKEEDSPSSSSTSREEPLLAKYRKQMQES